MNAQMDIVRAQTPSSHPTSVHPSLAESAPDRFSMVSFATSIEILDEIAALAAARQRGAALIVSDGDEFFGLDIFTTGEAIGRSKANRAKTICPQTGPVLVIVTFHASAEISRAAVAGWLNAIEALAPTVAAALTVALIAGARGVEFAELAITRVPTHDVNRHAALHCAAVEAVIENRIWKH